MLANGEAPDEIRPYLGGALGHAVKKTAKTGSMPDGQVDARPACAGEYWRRLIGKALLNTELETLQEHLKPFQLAVGIKAGAEVMPHAAREWMQCHSEDVDRVLLDTDESNAHNEVDRHLFLSRALEVIPGCCRWLEFIYPTAGSTCVFYRGRIIPSSAGGQQGDPLMQACHAL
eukprot:4642725-Karenia_brevis.AAC.1